MTRKRQRRSPTTAESLREYGRGIGGGFLFSLPLLLTMEPGRGGHRRTGTPPVCRGRHLHPVVRLNLYVGLRHDSTFGEVLVDSVEEMGIGIILSAGLLYLFARLDPAARFSEHLGLIVLEGMFAPLAIRLEPHNCRLVRRGFRRTAGPATHDQRRNRPGGVRQRADCRQCRADRGGAAARQRDAGAVKLLGIMAITLSVAALLLFYSDFKGSSRFAVTRGSFAVVHGSGDHLRGRTVCRRGAALVFREVRTSRDIDQCRSLPRARVSGTLGAAAGRLLLR